MTDEIRKTVNIQIGTEVAQPKLGLELSVIANSEVSKGHLQVLPKFDNEGTYFFVAVKSTSPQDLKTAIEEFLNTSLSVAKEMSPEIEGILGESQFDVAIHEDYVVAGVNLNNNPMAAQFAAMAHEIAASTLSHEASLKVGLVLDKSLNDLLTLEQDQMNHVKGNFHVLLTSSKADKYAIKRKIAELLRIEDDGDKLGKILLMMFSTAEFSLTADDKVSFQEATGEYLEMGKAQAQGMIEMGKGLYQGNKEMVDSFPFIQAFFDSVEQYGAGQIKVGVYNRIITAECDIYGSDLGQLYRQIVG